MHGGRLFVDPNSSRLVPIDTGELHQGIIYYPPEGLRSVSVQNYDPVLVFENNTKLTVFFEEEISKDNLEDNNERSSNIMIDVGLFGNKAVRIKSVEKDKLSILLNWNKYLNTKLVSTEQRLDLIRQAGKNNVTKYPINIKHKTGPQDFGTLYYLKKTIGELQNKK
jgi:hypothetical protein